MMGLGYNVALSLQDRIAYHDACDFLQIELRPQRDARIIQDRRMTSAILRDKMNSNITCVTYSMKQYKEYKQYIKLSSLRNLCCSQQSYRLRTFFHTPKVGLAFIDPSLAIISAIHNATHQTSNHGQTLPIHQELRPRKSCRFPRRHKTQRELTRCLYPVLSLG